MRESSQKPSSPPTADAVARMMRAEAKKNGGQVPKDSGAARVQSAHARGGRGKR